MGKFHDALENMGGSFELPDEFRTALTSAYDEDFSGAIAHTQGLENSLNERDATIEQMQNDHRIEINAVKADNWNMVVSGPPGSTPYSGNNEEDDDNDYSNTTIADLFG